MRALGLPIPAHIDDSLSQDAARHSQSQYNAGSNEPVVISDDERLERPSVSDDRSVSHILRLSNWPNANDTSDAHGSQCSQSSLSGATVTAAGSTTEAEAEVINNSSSSSSAVAAVACLALGKTTSRKRSQTLRPVATDNSQESCDNRQVARVSKGPGPQLLLPPTAKLMKIENLPPVGGLVLNDLTREQMAVLVHQASLDAARRHDQLQEVIADRRKLKRRMANQEKELTQIRELLEVTTHGSAVKKIQKQMNCSSSLELATGPSGKRLTAESVVALGIRRNFSNIAASDFGSTVLHAVSHQTVCRCEVRAASSSKAAFSFFLSQSLDAARTMANHCLNQDVNVPDRSWSLLGISYRADATNSGIWRRQKLHVLEVAAGYVDSSVEESNQPDFELHRQLYLDLELVVIVMGVK